MARPRSAQAHAKVLAAALELFADQGIDATSMDAIAAASGVSKATIYKHWPDKNRLALEVLAWLFGFDREPPPAASGDLRRDLVLTLGRQPAPALAALRARFMPHLIAYSARHPAFGHTWRKRVVERQRRALAAVLDRGVAAGRLRPGLPLDTAVAMLMGPLVYRNIFLGSHRGAAPPRGFVAAVVDAFLRAFGGGSEVP